MVPTVVSYLLPSTRDKLNLNEIDGEVVGESLLGLLSECLDSLYSDSNCNVEEQLKKMKVVLDVSWEKLNTGHYSEVSLSWRGLYSYASLVKALALLQDGKYQESVKACDWGLLMGSPILDNLIAKVASQICQQHWPPTTETSKDDQIQKKLKRSQAPTIREDRSVSRSTCPSLERFLKEFVISRLPCVVESAIDYWPALSHRKWSVGYLLRKIGWRTVPVEIGAKYTDEGWSQRLMTFADFVQRFILNHEEGESVGYLAQHQIFQQIPELTDDIAVPSYCYLSEGSENVDPDVNVWFGPGGTVSPLHFDPKDNLLTQVFGEKYVRLYAEEVTPFVYPHEGRLLHNTSQVDVECVDDRKFPLFKEAPFQECILREGEQLYIPAKCWHYVRSLSVSLSISFWWQSKSVS